MVRVRAHVELAAFATLRIPLHIVKAVLVAIVATVCERLAQALEQRFVQSHLLGDKEAV